MDCKSPVAAVGRTGCPLRLPSREAGRILVLRIRKESEDALPRLGGEHGPGNVLLDQITLAIEEEEKEPFCFDNRAPSRPPNWFRFS
jgi:hypothetical protein